MRPLLFIVFISLSFSLPAGPKIYKKVNPDGSVEYSDVPQDEMAKPIKLKPLQSITLPPLPQTSISKPAPTKPKLEPKPFKYESVNIVSPQDDEAIRSNNGDFSAKAKLTPGLQSDLEHRLQWFMDGKALPDANTLNLSLKNVDRGTHQLQLRVLNFDDETVVETPTISFHLLRVALGSGNIFAPPPAEPLAPAPAAP